MGGIEVAVPDVPRDVDRAGQPGGQSAGQVGVVGHIKIGDGVKIGAQAGVTNNVEAGQAVVGSPAQPITQAKRSLLLLKELPEFRKKLRELDKNLRRLIKGS